jgi:hypothetical protein
MTIEQRLEHLEQQNQRTQRSNKRLTVALTMTVVAMCAVVTMAFRKETEIDMLVAGKIVTKDLQVVGLAEFDLWKQGGQMGPDDLGEGVAILENGIVLSSDEFKGATSEIRPDFIRFVKETRTQVFVGGEDKSRYDPPSSSVSNTNTGGGISIYNRTGERIIDLRPDEYGNGLVGAWNRKGKGQTLQPGP